MSTPFGCPLDFQRIDDYAITHTPEGTARASRRWPCDAFEVLAIAGVLRRLGRQDHACALYSEGFARLEADPGCLAGIVDLGVVYFLFGILLTEGGRSELAIEALNKAQQYRQNPATKLWLAENFRRIGETARAKEALTECLSLPSSELAKWLSDRQIRYAIALRSELTKPSSENEDSEPNSEVFAQLSDDWDAGRTLLHQGDYLAAAERYRKALSLLRGLYEEGYPGVSSEAVRENLANGSLDLAICLLEIDSEGSNEAIHALLDAIRFGGDEPSLQSNLLFCIQKAGEQMGWRDQFLGDTPANRQAAALCARGCRFLREEDAGCLARAAECFRSAIQEASSLAAGYHFLGLVLERLHEDEDAIQAWLKVKELEPEFDFRTGLCVRTVGWTDWDEPSKVANFPNRIDLVRYRA